MAFPAGRRLGRWVVERELGRGAMGVVLAARDERTGERAALKLLPRSNDLELVARLAREARAAAKVKDPHVVALLDVAELPEGLVLAFELVPGGTLAAKAPLPWREAVLRATEIALGLDAIHQVGLVHRDLKPENVLVDADGRAKIADLGLVKGVAGTSLAESRATETGAIVGTPHYLAPEQIEGRPEPASDLYALGATLHHLIAGAPPFAGQQGMALLKAHLSTRPPRLGELVKDLPPAIDEIVQRLLDKNPARRGTAREVARALERCASGRGLRRSLGVIATIGLVAATGIGGLAAVAQRRARAAEVERVVATALQRSSANDVAGAIGEIVDALSRGNESARLLAELAFLRVRQRDPKRALADAERAVALDPREPHAFCARAYARVNVGESERGRVDAERAIQLAPTLARAHRVHALALYRLGKVEESLRANERAIQLDARDATARVNRGVILHEQGDLAGARAEIERALEIDPTESSALYQLARVLLALGDVQGARRTADRLVALLPADGASYELRAQVRIRAGDPDGADADFGTAVEREPKFVSALLGRVYLRLGPRNDPEGARADLREALRIAPNDPDVLTAMAAVHFRAGELDAALDALDRVVRQRPGDFVAHQVRAQIHARRREPGDRERAIADYDVVLANVKTPNERASALADRASLRLDGGPDELDAARADAEEAIRLTPKDAVTCVAAARVRLRVGDRTGARAAAEQALASAPRGSDLATAARRVLNELDR